MESPIKVPIWNEVRHEKYEESIKKVYNVGLHLVLSKYLNKNNNVVVDDLTIEDIEFISQETKLTTSEVKSIINNLEV